jgi:hypothetical protein
MQIWVSPNSLEILFKKCKHGKILCFVAKTPFNGGLDWFVYGVKRHFQQYNGD